MIVTKVCITGAGEDVVFLLGELRLGGVTVATLPVVGINLYTGLTETVYEITGVEADKVVIGLANADISGHIVSVDGYSCTFGVLPGFWQMKEINLPAIVGKGIPWHWIAIGGLALVILSRRRK